MRNTGPPSPPPHPHPQGNQHRGPGLRSSVHVHKMRLMHDVLSNLHAGEMTKFCSPIGLILHAQLQQFSTGEIHFFSFVEFILAVLLGRVEIPSLNMEATVYVVDRLCFQEMYRGNGSVPNIFDIYTQATFLPKLECNFIIPLLHETVRFEPWFVSVLLYQRIIVLEASFFFFCAP